MTDNLKILAVITAYVAATIFTWGALNADLRGDLCKYNSFIGDASEARSDMAVNLFFAALPPLWVASPFMTGFYQYGWTISGAPASQAECDMRRGGNAL